MSSFACSMVSILTTMNYILYFSYYRLILSRTIENTLTQYYFISRLIVNFDKIRQNEEHFQNILS